MTESSPARGHRLTAVTVAAVFTAGCVPAIPLRTGVYLKDSEVAQIAPRRTTKKELFELLGAPMAIVANGETASIPSPTVWRGGGIQHGGYQEIQADAVFELFSQHALTEYHRVYYYFYAVSQHTAIILVLAVLESSDTDIDKLWVLVNERTGVVEDYVFRKAED